MPNTHRTHLRKGISAKLNHDTIWKDSTWLIVTGELKRRPGRPERVNPLFDAVAEKLPFESLTEIERDFRLYETLKPYGVYVAHDSMGHARYVGRGHVFQRLRARKRAHVLELLYFSFYIVRDKKHEREVETLLIRACGANLHFNSRKKRVDIQPGNVRDFESGTVFYERRYRRAKKR